MGSRQATSPGRWRYRKIPCHRILRFCLAPGWCRRGGSAARLSIAPISSAFRPSCCSCSEIVATGGRKYARRSLKASHLVVRRSRGGRPMSERIYNVLFLCTGNSARSILAESILRKDGRGRFRSFSAGSQPKGQINPFALKVLESLNYPADGMRSKSWAEFARPDAPILDFVFTVCDNAAGESCPVWPGQPMTAHWGVPDPAEASRNPAEIALAFKDAYRMLHQRIGIFVALPIRSLDQLSLARRLKDIGRMAGATAKAAEPT